MPFLRCRRASEKTALQSQNKQGTARGPFPTVMTCQAGPHEFHSTIDKHNVRQFGPRPCPIDTSRLRPRSDHTCFTRLSISRTYDSLAPGPAGFTKNLVYFLCKVCYTVISVRRDGQTRAEKKRNTRAFCGQRDHLPDDSGSKGMALAAWNLCAFLAYTPVLKGVYE